jgi:tetratricopeptide (TPR) repeat protein
LKASWQKQVIASSGYRELGMFDDAANALEEIEPGDKSRNEVLYARVDIYLAAKKWHLAAAVASHLVKADPENPAAWINLAYAVRRDENIEAAEAILLKACAWHPQSALIAFNLACYASVVWHMEEAKARLQHAIDLDNDIRRLALDDEDLRPLWDWIGRISDLRRGIQSPIRSRCSHWRKSPRNPNFSAIWKVEIMQRSMRLPDFPAISEALRYSLRDW